ncbi:PAS domain S-box protein [Sesbania bispinosa]|nr:PAS domain S-box protein [Sesbania bispinosa]
MVVAMEVNSCGDDGVACSAKDEGELDKDDGGSVTSLCAEILWVGMVLRRGSVAGVCERYGGVVLCEIRDEEYAGRVDAVSVDGSSENAGAAMSIGEG